MTPVDVSAVDKPVRVSVATAYVLGPSIVGCSGYKLVMGHVGL